jgi:hypothetical protein
VIVIKSPYQIGPWQHGAWLHVGGLVGIGFADDGHLLTVSWSGRGLFDLTTGARVARDDTDPVGASWLSTDRLTVEAIGTFAGQCIPLTGIWGGTARTATDDGWSLSVQSNRGAIQKALLTGPNGDAEPLLLSSPTEYRTISFSPDDGYLILAASGDVQVLKRV